MKAPPALSRRTFWAILLLVGIGLFFYRGTLDTPDEVQMALTAQGLVERQSFQFEREYYGRWNSGYGVGTPLIGIPFYLATKLFISAGLLAEDTVGLFSISSLACLAFFGLAVAGMTGRPGLSALVAALSPLLPGALAAYSENLSAAALVALMWSVWRPPPRGAVVMAFLAGLLGVLARSAMLPFLAFVAVWGWREGARRSIIAAGSAGMAIGSVVTLCLNHVLQGNAIAGAYGGTDFTTPMPVGVFGLLFSAERGLLLFWPVVVLPFLAWRELDAGMRSLARLAYTILGFSLAFHGAYWAWHGGWSAGTRFMLPMIAALAPVVVASLAAWPCWGTPRRIAAAAMLAWSGVMALIYATHSPMAWWTTLWRFHQEENIWLFIPQASLWVAALGGWAEPARAELFPATMAAGAAMALAGAVGLVRGDALRAAMALEIPWRRLALPLAALALVAVSAPLRGPRGWTNDQGDIQRFMVINEPGRWRGIFDKRIDGPVIFRTRAAAIYGVAFDGRELVSSIEPVPRHVRTVETGGNKGQFPIEVVAETIPGEEFIFSLYSSWSGSGVWIFPLGGEYVFPRELTPMEAIFTQVWRKRAILLALAISGMMLLCVGGAPGGASLVSAGRPTDH